MRIACGGASYRVARPVERSEVHVEPPTKEFPVPPHDVCGLAEDGVAVRERLLWTSRQVKQRIPLRRARTEQSAEPTATVVDGERTNRGTIEKLGQRLVSPTGRQHCVEALVQLLTNPNQHCEFPATQFTHHGHQ